MKVQGAITIYIIFEADIARPIFISQLILLRCKDGHLKC